MVRSGFFRSSVSDLTLTAGALWCGGVVPPSLAPTGSSPIPAGRGLFDPRGFGGAGSIPAVGPAHLELPAEIRCGEGDDRSGMRRKDAIRAS